MKIEVNTIIDSPVDKVWKYVTDLSNLAKLNPNVREIRQTSTGSLGLGTTLNAIVGERFVKRAMSIRVIEYEPNKKLSLEHTSGPSKGTKTSFVMEAFEGKTRLTCVANIQLNGFYKLIGPFIAGRARNEVINEMNNEKKSIEAQP